MKGVRLELNLLSYSYKVILLLLVYCLLFASCTLAQDQISFRGDNSEQVGELSTKDLYGIYIFESATPFTIIPKEIGVKCSGESYFYCPPVGYQSFYSSDPRIKLVDLKTSVEGYALYRIEFDDIYETETFTIYTTFSGTALTDYCYGGTQNYKEDFFEKNLAWSITSTGDPNLTDEERGWSAFIDSGVASVTNLHGLLYWVKKYGGASRVGRDNIYPDGPLIQRDIDTVKYNDAICTDTLALACRVIKQYNPNIEVRPVMTVLCYPEKMRKSDGWMVAKTTESFSHIELQIKQSGQEWVTFDPSWVNEKYVVKARSIPLGSSYVAGKYGYLSSSENVDSIKIDGTYFYRFKKVPADE